MADRSGRDRCALVAADATGGSAPGRGILFKEKGREDE